MDQRNRYVSCHASDLHKHSTGYRPPEPVQYNFLTINTGAVIYHTVLRALARLWD